VITRKRTFQVSKDSFESLVESVVSTLCLPRKRLSPSGNGYTARPHSQVDYSPPQARSQHESGVCWRVEWKSWKTGRLPPPDGRRSSMVMACSAAVAASDGWFFGLVEVTRKLSSELVHTGACQKSDAHLAVFLRRVQRTCCHQLAGSEPIRFGKLPAELERASVTTGFPAARLGGGWSWLQPVA
jgi:hypothetical protein